MATVSQENGKVQTTTIQENGKVQTTTIQESEEPRKEEAP